MKIIGLTGGIGSGKTTVSKYLKAKGFPVIDADQVARDIVAPGMKANLAIGSTFGGEVMNVDGSINRKKLGDLVFSDQEKLDKLNGITHEEIVGTIKKSIAVFKGKKEPILFIDAPLLFEVGLDALVEDTWVIDTPEDVRIQRIQKRDLMEVDKIRARMETQMDQASKNAKATVIIDNSNGMGELISKIDQLIKIYET